MKLLKNILFTLSLALVCINSFASQSTQSSRSNVLHQSSRTLPQASRLRQAPPNPTLLRKEQDANAACCVCIVGCCMGGCVSALGALGNSPEISGCGALAMAASCAYAMSIIDPDGPTE